MIPYLSIIAAAILLAIIAELIARLVLKNCLRSYVWEPNFKQQSSLNPEAFPPPLMPETIRLEVNSLGELSSEPPKTKDLYKVLLYGGSAAECYFLDKNDNWPKVLADELNQPEKIRILKKEEAHVGNLAKSGVDGLALIPIIDETLKHYKNPDLVIFMVGAGDIIRWLSRGGLAEEDLRPLDLAEHMSVVANRAYGWQPRQLALVELARRLRSKFSTAVQTKTNAGTKLKELRSVRQSATILQSHESPQQMLDRFSEQFEIALKRCQGSAKRILVVHQPWFYGSPTEDETRAFWNFAIGSIYSGRCEEYFATELVGELMAAVAQRSRDLCSKMGIEDLDLLPFIEPNLETFYDFNHFTPKGAKVVAKAIAEAVIQGHDTHSH